MIASLLRWQGIGLGAILLGLALASSCRADGTERWERSGVGDGRKGQIIKIDLSKLPPGLAKQMRKYARQDKDEKGRSKGSTADRGKDRDEIRLPPGLAKKP